MLRRTVLVVDDVPINRALMRRTLEAAGAAVIEASDGQVAYEVYKGSGPAALALVLMDCRMPVLDGWQATERIRELEEAAGWPAVPIVACTTEDLSPGSPALERCWACGMSAATCKPLSRDAARQLLEHWTGASGGHQPCGAQHAAASDCSSSLPMLCGEPSVCSLASASSADSGSVHSGTASGMLADRGSLELDSGCLPVRAQNTLRSGFSGKRAR